MTERNKKINQLFNQGLSYRAIGKLVGLSRARIHQIISGYPSIGNFKRIKMAVFSRDNFKCQWGVCCKQQNIAKDKLIIHHIDFNDKNNDLKNLITLCKKCHCLFHTFNHIDEEKEKKLNASPTGIMAKDRNDYMKQYRKKNKENVKQYNKIWRKKHTGYFKEYYKKYRNKKRCHDVQ